MNPHLSDTVNTAEDNAEDDENEKYGNNENLHERSTSSCSDLRALEVKSLRQDMDNLQAVLEKITATHQSQMSNLSCKLEDSAGAMQQGMSSLTEQMATQTSCLTDAIRANRVIPNDAPV